MKYKELKSFLDARARVIDDLTIKVNELKHMLSQKLLINHPEFHHKEDEMI